MAERKYDSTVARIAGNILSGSDLHDPNYLDFRVKKAVEMARLIVAETKRTEPVVDGNREG